ncbi:SmpA/OmlA family protein [Tamilnaduibacter salinus]|uniref:Outer membrane protein assembly factor BamE n=1 Tax=Tamilnaduibacter salinus TaxID=1484056 RepID=A0A2U1CW85_9GAMM|nr:outer membrane protein assembly factor BamE [Tamilnaduibacter salinus]PVY75961.1 SmpA/OmlA family protein [Tamilnaduibacter salinus]
MKSVLALSLALLMTGCVFPGVYRIDVQQGNILDEEDLARLDSGMSRSDVRNALGSPIMLNPVDDSREYYVYTYQEDGGEIREQRVVVYYEGDQYSHYEANLLEETPAY